MKRIYGDKVFFLILLCFVIFSSLLFSGYAFAEDIHTYDNTKAKDSSTTESSSIIYNENSGEKIDALLNRQSNNKNFNLTIGDSLVGIYDNYWIDDEKGHHYFYKDTHMQYDYYPDLERLDLYPGVYDKYYSYITTEEGQSFKLDLRGVISLNSLPTTFTKDGDEISVEYVNNITLNLCGDVTISIPNHENSVEGIDPFYVNCGIYSEHKDEIDCGNFYIIGNSLNVISKENLISFQTSGISLCNNLILGDGINATNINISNIKIINTPETFSISRFSGIQINKVSADDSGILNLNNHSSINISNINVSVPDNIMGDIKGVEASLINIEEFASINLDDFTIYSRIGELYDDVQITGIYIYDYGTLNNYGQININKDSNKYFNLTVKSTNNAPGEEVCAYINGFYAELSTVNNYNLININGLKESVVLEDESFKGEIKAGDYGIYCGMDLNCFNGSSTIINNYDNCSTSINSINFVGYNIANYGIQTESSINAENSCIYVRSAAINTNTSKIHKVNSVGLCCLSNKFVVSGDSNIESYTNEVEDITYLEQKNSSIVAVGCEISGTSKVKANSQLSKVGHAFDAIDSIVLSDRACLECKSAIDNCAIVSSSLTPDVVSCSEDYYPEVTYGPNEDNLEVKFLIEEDEYSGTNSIFAVKPVSFPTIIASDKVFNLGTELNIETLDASAIDYAGNIIDVIISNDGGYNKNISGIYNITLSATDNLGQTSYKEIIVTLEENPYPVPSYTNTPATYDFTFIYIIACISLIFWGRRLFLPPKIN